ncbi:MAG: GGDEF domain-containing protein, partial [Burkholderiales bacterium]
MRTAGVLAALAALLLAILWIALAGGDQDADRERRVGASIATLALLVAGCALYAWLRRSRLLAVFAVWTASMSLCAAASALDLAWPGATPSAASVTALQVAAYCVHLASTVWLLLALFGHDLASPRLRLGIRIVPAAGVVAALAVLVMPPALALPALPYAAGLVAVLVLLASLHTLATTHVGQLSLFLAGWAAHAVGAMRDSLAPAGANDPPGWLWAETGAIAFAACACLVVVRTLLAEIRQRDRAERNALDAARKYRHVYYSAPVAMISVDLLGQVLRWNDQAAHLFRHELRQGRLNTLAGILGTERAAALIAEATATGRHRSEFDAPPGDVEGGHRICAIDALLAADAIEITLADVTERSLLARTLEHMAYHDSLTDRLNRRGLEREIGRLIRAVEHGARASLIFVDLDRFKAINDVFGHAAGDSVVIEVANRL